MLPIVIVAGAALLLIGCAAGVAVRDSRFTQRAVYDVVKDVYPPRLVDLPLEVSAQGTAAEVELLEAALVEAIERWRRRTEKVPGMPADGPFILVEPNLGHVEGNITAELTVPSYGIGNSSIDWICEPPYWRVRSQGGWVQASPGLADSPACVAAVLDHELGHILGLADDVSTGGVMDENGLCNDRPLTEPDFAVLLEVWSLL